MATIQVDVDLAYPSELWTVPANAKTQYQFTPVAGEQLLSWGFSFLEAESHLRIVLACVVPAPASTFRFVADVENTDSSDHNMEWFFVAMKM